ncbi:MAG: hypothetical protein A3I89_02590 [Candidatus Harrisonbacteria bacterium RIFCSPLOWO2_02_FULL_41_11]|uniref:Uncharacterized protein n=1 Tax=Candidatus Harrisonbacteria bacterium RIFCSPHIGHO2_02_FULL_42_16 TaxID=1798404 RepID=A0A1G1ZIZ9_9BACT|nr:MAG: hypothetical protein A3B92_00300 [Candidatus Harrisonbacteria bacterium RIFCSPHIGHO2_02_FULL_42_16]OGY66548.1 MAG: hypothetical protein A3I89_02590 [Candidatus Harrisonbacteria bacterium RIFCSPLOWO2_02_FULL_41_11]
MLLFFPVPVENVEKAKEVLMLYKDLIVEIKVSRSGSVINVYAHYTEEIPTRFFYVLLKKEVCNSEEVVKKLSEDLLKRQIIYEGKAWQIQAFNRDSFL